MDELKQASDQALAELYQWHDNDPRFIGRLDRVRDYLAALEAVAPAPTQDNLPAPTEPDAPTQPPAKTAKNKAE